MKDREPWDRFMGSGRIEDYLRAEERPYMNYAERPYLGKDEKPNIGIAEMIAMNNTMEASGMSGMEPFGMNVLPVLAMQQAMKADDKGEEKDFPR